MRKQHWRIAPLAALFGGARRASILPDAFGRDFISPRATGAQSQNRLLWIIATPLIVAAFASPAHALSCGDSVSASVTLTADIVCDTAKYGLTVTSDNVTINLNGHTISCTWTQGYLGSCQNGGPQTPITPNAGIRSWNYKHVKLLGAGVISGFQTGVSIVGGTDLTVEGVEITGPAIPSGPDFVNRRYGSVGLYATQHDCPSGFLVVPQTPVTISHNDISNHESGILIDSSSCVSVFNNHVHDNGGIDFSAGIEIISGLGKDASFNIVYDNIVTRNGVNDTSFSMGGIVIDGESPANKTRFNTIYLNDASWNCGNGISVFGGNAEYNNVIHNFALSNSTTTFGNECLAPVPSVFFDMKTTFPGPGNIWTTDNTCQTKSAGIPAGVCM